MAASSGMGRGGTREPRHGRAVNPFTYARMTITTPRRIAEVHAVVDRLRAEGFQDGSRRYRVRGSRHGDRFALSLEIGRAHV